MVDSGEFEIAFQFEADTYGGDTATGLDVVDALRAAQQALVEVDQALLLRAVATGKISQAQLPLIHEVLRCLTPWRVEVRGIEKGSLVLIAAAYGVPWLLKHLNLEEKLWDAGLGLLGETQVIKDLKKTLVEVLDIPYAALKKGLTKCLTRFGFTPRVTEAGAAATELPTTPSRTTIRLAARNVDQITASDQRCQCCCAH